MRYHFRRKHFYRMAVMVGLGVVAGMFLLWFWSGSKKPAQNLKNELEPMAASLFPVVAAIEMPTLTATVVLTPTEMPLAPVKKVVTPTVTAPIYVLSNGVGTNVINVWQFLPENNRWSKLYTITYPLDKSGEVAVPVEEMERMKKYLANQIPPIHLLADPVFRPHPMYLVLSPTTKQLAFVEWYSYSADRSEEGYFGVVYTGNFTPETNQSQIFFQSPFELLIDEMDYFTGLDEPLWSPDEQYYSTEYEVVHLRNTPLIINVNTGEVQRLEGAADLFGPLAWSPDSTTVFLYLYRSGFDSSGGVIRLCEIEPVSCRDIELDGIWIDAWMVDWSPQRNEIVFAGADEDFKRSPSPPPFSLYLFDPETDKVRELVGNFNRSLAKPHWSPDGRLIAAEYNPEGVVASPNTIVIVDPEARQVINEIPIQGCAWQWEQNSQSIVQLQCGEQHSLKLFSVIDATSQSIPLPDELGSKVWLGLGHNTFNVY